MIDHTEIANSLLAHIDSQINNNYYEKLNIDAIAFRSGYSKWHIQKIFHKTTGETIARYIRRKRIDRAKVEILHTNFSIYSIAVNYGFDSQQAFTRVFSKQFGMPPGRYRKAFKKD